MNNMDNKNVGRMGVVLTDNVDLNWIREIEESFNKSVIKYDVNMKTNKVSIGVRVHSYTQPEMGSTSDLLRGFINLKTGEITYESNLNIGLNESLGTCGETTRIIVDKDTIERINNILLAWVIL